MASSYVNNLRLEEIATGEQSGTWGDTTNTNLKIIGQAVAWGTRAIANASTDNITIGDGALDADRCLGLKLTGGGQACTVTLLPNTSSKTWFMYNATAAALTFTCGSGANVIIPAGQTKVIATDGLGSGGVVHDLLTAVNLAGITTVDDLAVTDDLVVGDDASVGGILGVTGVLTTTAATVFNGGFASNADSTMGTNKKLIFRDSAIHISSVNDGDLMIVADDEIDITSTLIDVNGNLDVSGTALVTGVLTTTAATVFNGGFASNAASTISTADNLDTLQLISTDADGNGGPNLRFYRNSGSPADNDLMAKVDFEGRNDNSQDVVYASIENYALDVSDGTEDGELTFYTMVAGTSRNRLDFTNTQTIFNESSVDVDFRVESNANINMLLVDAGGEVVTIGGLAGSTSEDAGYFPLQVGNTGSGSTVLQMLVASDGFNTIHFGDGVSGTARYRGYLQYGMADEIMSFGASAATQMQLSSTALFIGTGVDIRTTTLGSNNVRFGLNAGDGILSGGNQNVAIGDYAGTAITTGDSNTALGYNTLASEDTGNQNTAVGHTALANLNSGTNYNVAVGSGAGKEATTAAACTFIGGISGQFVSTGNSSTFVGYSAGLGITGAKLTGADNTAVGRDSGLLLQGSANGNSLFGRNSGDAITTGSRITAIGYGALSAETTGTRATAVGYFALAVQNKAAESHNTAVGYNSSGAVTSGDHNTSMGYGSFDDCIDASYNTAIGSGSLSADCGNSNTAIGYAAGNAATGVGSTFLGQTAGFYPTSANYCTFVGHQAGYGISGTRLTGAENVAVGHNAGVNLQGAAGSCTLIGSYAGDSVTTGSSNTVMGYNAGPLLNTGDFNVLIGISAGSALTTGRFNTAVGPNACGNSNQTGGFNVYLGYLASASANNISGSIIITSGNRNSIDKGASSGFIDPDLGNMFQGNNSANWSTTSDRRLKKNIVDSSIGLAEINQIQVRNFEYRTKDEITDFDNTVVDAAGLTEAERNAIGVEGVQVGVIAQEIQAVLPKCIKEESTGVLSVNPDNLTWHLIKAVQELSAKNDALEARIETLEG